jgi:carboxyl-terminal processing protease
VLKAVKDLDKNGLKGLVLDLRENPGGLLTSAVDISDMFIKDGLIVTIKPRDGQNTPYVKDPRESPDSTFVRFPMVCLVDGNSASGSEIVAACLQDQKRAVVMGERSYGKGSVQTIQPFEGGEMKVTTATFWRPNGKNLNKSSTEGKESDVWGVTPNKGYALKITGSERRDLITAFDKSQIIPRRDLPPKPATDKDQAATKPGFQDRQLGMALDYLKTQISKTAKSQETKSASAKPN